MAKSDLNYKILVPGPANLEQRLQGTMAFWRLLERYIRAAWPAATGQWRFYSKKTGWWYVITYQGNVLVSCLPCEGYFQTAFVIGERAAHRIRQHGKLPGHIVDTMEKTLTYAQGKSLVIDVKRWEDYQTVQQLLQLQMEQG